MALFHSRIFSITFLILIDNASAVTLNNETPPPPPILRVGGVRPRPFNVSIEIVLTMTACRSLLQALGSYKFLMSAGIGVKVL